MPEMGINWFRLLVEPFAVIGMFLLILTEPEEKIKAWRRKRRTGRARPSKQKGEA